jgi:hypothetical protein
MAEIGRIEIDAADVLDFTKLKQSAFDEKGHIRWPQALPMVRAWRFTPAPRLRDVLQKQLSYESTTRAVLLDAVDTSAVLALPNEIVPVRETSAVLRLRELNDALRFSGPTTGPRPLSWSGTASRDAQEESFTYAFQFGSRELWKIGHAKDVESRLAEVNTHVPHEVLGEQWRPALQQHWPNEGAAYDMEQRVLTALRTPSCIGERVLCSKRKLESAWSSAIIARSV